MKHLNVTKIQVLKKATAGDTFGEIGVLYNRPQCVTVRTTELSQILRLSRTSLMNAMHANPEAAKIIMTNLFRVISILYFGRLLLYNMDLES